MSIPRVRGRYLLIGALIGFAAPLGVFLLRYHGAPPGAGAMTFWSRDFDENWLVYLYLTVGSLLTMGVSAWIVGTHTDRITALARRLEGMAMRDPVTGLFNTRYMERRLTSEISRAERTRRPLSCLLVRIAGIDHLVATVAEPDLEPLLSEMGFILRSTCREFDVVGHHDQNAYLMVLPETDLYNAWIVATRILDAVAAGPFKLMGAPSAVGVNIGGAEIDHEVRWPNQVLEAARSALERAADIGENQVILHQPASLRPPAPGHPSAPPAHA